MLKSRSFIATPPGATIEEQMLDQGLGYEEFAQRMNMSETCVRSLIDGEIFLTSDIAARLETVLGTPARFWSSLETIYREKLVKAAAENQLDAVMELAEPVCS